MNNIIKYTGIFLLALAVKANAAQVGVSASATVTNLPNAGNQFDGVTTVANGSLIQIGYFTNGTLSTGTQITPAEIAQLQASFFQFGSNTFLNVAVPGKLTNVIMNTSFGPTRPTNQLAVWIWNTSSTGTATQVGIFTATNWVFPGLDSGAGSTVTLSFLTNYINTGSLQALAGSFDPAGSYTLPNFRSANLAEIFVIPEPSAAVALLGLSGMIARRRKRS